MNRAVLAKGSSAERWEAESDIESLAAEGHAATSRMYQKVRAYIVHVTPVLAELMLEQNVRNRRVSERHITVLSQIMASRDMRLNGETIIFSSDGRLLDGQHRLLACVKSGVAFDTIVVFGIDSDAFDTIDTGSTRSTGDILGINGIASANKVASAVQALLAFVDNGGFLTGSCATNHVRKATPVLVTRVLEAHPGIFDSISAMGGQRLMRGQHGYALHYVFSLVDKSLASDFSDILANGSRDMGRPFCRLRESLITSPLTNETRSAYSAKAVLAFNAERAGARPKILRVGADWPRVDGLDFDALERSMK